MTNADEFRLGDVTYTGEGVAIEWDAAPPTVDEIREAAMIAAQSRVYECTVTLVSPRIADRLQRLHARIKAAEVIAERARIARRPRRIPVICGLPKWQRGMR